jgi:hypothetical protein
MHLYTGPGYVVAQADGGSGTMIPRMAIMDKGSVPFTYPPGLPNQANGVAFISGSNPDQPFFVNIINCGTNPIKPNAQAVTLRLWSRGNDVGGSDNGIEGFSANGGFDNPTYTKCGDKLLKLAGFGYATNGYAINDAAVINLNADQDFSDTNPIQWPMPGGTMTAPNPASTKAGGSVSIETCQLDQNAQVVRQVWDSRGNTAIGSFPRAGNNFPCGGAVILKECTQEPTASVGGAGVLYVKDGALKYRGPNGTVTNLAAA